MLFMFKFIVRVDHDVIKVGCTEVIKIVKEHIIHVSLVSSRPICESKWNYLVLVAAISGPECSKVLQGRVYAYTVKCLANVELGKDLSLADLSQSLIKQWEWVTVLAGCGIQLTVVNTEAESSIGLSGE